MDRRIKLAAAIDTLTAGYLKLLERRNSTFRDVLVKNAHAIIEFRPRE